MAGGNGNSPINLDIDEATARGMYANFAAIAHTPAEFMIDFAFVLPQQSKNKVSARIITSPSHMKNFAAALADNIRKYEEQFGEIKA